MFCPLSWQREQVRNVCRDTATYVANRISDDKNRCVTMCNIRTKIGQMAGYAETSGSLHHVIRTKFKPLELSNSVARRCHNSLRAVLDVALRVLADIQNFEVRHPATP